MHDIKIKPEEIAFDIDGVVADTMSSFLKVARDDFGISHLRKEQITTYWLEECLPIDEEIIKAIIERILTDPFGVELKPIAGAVDVLRQLNLHAPLRFVTARPVKRPIEEWLQAILKTGDHGFQVIATGRHEIKVEILKELGIRYFVEDHLETCQAIHDEGLNSIVFDQPWNQGSTPFLRVKNWRELQGLLDV
ncbi:MAG: haloacid dehalogenase [Thermodesulfatator sp.]|nr:MAG: haloacid dehalogenase [Thermodesulfatator sp.]